MDNTFYRDFEDRNRGSRELIQSRLCFYLPFLKPLIDQSSAQKPLVLDLGCGRGEWLELMLESGFQVQGVDQDEGMLSACRERQLPVINGDAIAYLRKQADQTVAVVSAFHVAEHIGFGDLQALVSEAFRALIPGGLLILETPNPENIVVGSSSFYMDPTHTRPIPPLLLSFLFEFYHFHRNKIVRLQESPELHQAEAVNILQVLEGVSPDYAVIGQKQADAHQLAKYDDVFNRDYGLDLHALGHRYDGYTSRQFEQFNARLVESEAKVNQALAHSSQAMAELNNIYNSRSWRLTAPLRYLIKCVRFARERFKVFTHWALWRFFRFDIDANKYKTWLPDLALLTARHQKQSNRRTLYYWIDHTCQFGSNTGIQRVTRCLAKGLIENGESVVFVRWHMRTGRLMLATKPDLHRLSKWNGPVYTAEFLSAYSDEQNDITFVEHTDMLGQGVLLIPEVPHMGHQKNLCLRDVREFADKNHLKMACLFYDAIPIKLPEYSDISTSHADYMKSLAVADLLVPISEFVAGDLQQFFADNAVIDSDKKPYIKPLLLAGENSNVARVIRHHLNEAKLILCLGSIEPRKNQLTLLKAFIEISRRHNATDWQLVFVGNKNPLMAEEWDQLIAAHSNVRHMMAVEDEELWRLFGQCAFTVFPSVEEGFGLPIVESLWHGKPCICANFGSMFEIAEQGGCMTVDTRSIDALSVAMETLMFDMPQRLTLIKEAVSRPMTTWNEYAQQCVELLSDLFGGTEQKSATQKNQQFELKKQRHQKQMGFIAFGQKISLRPLRHAIRSAGSWAAQQRLFRLPAEFVFKRFPKLRFYIYHFLRSGSAAASDQASHVGNVQPSLSPRGRDILDMFEREHRRRQH